METLLDKTKAKIQKKNWLHVLDKACDRNQVYLFKNKGNFVYNYKLRKYELMNDTPMHFEFKYIQEIKKDLWKNALA